MRLQGLGFEMFRVGFRASGLQRRSSERFFGGMGPIRLPGTLNAEPLTP